MKHIFDHAGVMFQAEYTRDGDGTPVFNGIHVLDEAYRPVGANLIPVFANLMMWITPGRVGPVMDPIIEELPA